MQSADGLPHPHGLAIKWPPRPVDDVMERLQGITEAPMRAATLAGGLSVLAMLLLSSPGVHVVRAEQPAGNASAAAASTSPAPR